MGSDTEPSVLLAAIFNAADQFAETTHLTLFGTPSLFAGKHAPSPRIALCATPEFITMDDPPLAAVRKKKKASLCVGIQMLRDQKLHAFISAGNTGALMGAATLHLPLFPNMKRPALLTLLPTQDRPIAMLDVGANTSYTAEQLVQFAFIGSMYQKARGIEKPRVGLLNIGTEAKKGPPLLQKAHFQLSSAASLPFSFAGNVEARDIFQGHIDVLVTDGFTGNIFLKTAEGMANTLMNYLEKTHPELPPHRGFHPLRYDEYPGALLCGIEGIVIKCHGNVSASSMIHSIIQANRLVQHHFLKTLSTLITQLTP